MVFCPTNPCSKNGVCLNSSIGGVSYCKCKPGWTGVDCSSKSFSLPSVLPYGELYQEDRRHFWDVYADFHPVLNVSTHSFIFLECDPKEFHDMYDPHDMWVKEEIKCDFHFYNGNVPMQFLKDVALRIKGSATRYHLKRGFRISFKKFNYKERRFFGLESLGFKTADPGLIRAFLAFEMYRAVGVPSQRSSFATLFLNGKRQLGVYWMSEEVNDGFFQARYENWKANGYKCGQAMASLQYLGDDVNVYRSMSRVFNRKLSFVYEALNKNSDFLDFVRLVRILNSTSDSAFPIEISKIFNVDLYLRVIALEVVSFINQCCFFFSRLNLFC